VLFQASGLKNTYFLRPQSLIIFLVLYANLPPVLVCLARPHRNLRQKGKLSRTFLNVREENLVRAHIQAQERLSWRRYRNTCL
jgi:hypothetical protein